MPVFISHSFENKPEFDNIADALEQKRIDYWKPGSLKAGASLSDQLRQSIVECELCVFVATRHSVQSSWCGAELGAFWGVGKPVVIYVAEASLSEDEMPKQFKGQLVERRIARVVDAVQDYLAKSQPPEQRVPDRLPTVASMSVEDLKSLVTEAVNRIQDVSFVETTLSRVALLLGAKRVTENSAEYRELRELLTDLLGVRGTLVREGAKRSGDWKHTFSFSTDTGDWAGLAQSYGPADFRSSLVDLYRECLVWRVGENQRVEAVAAVPSATDHSVVDIVSLGTPYLIVGRGALGSVRVQRPIN